MYVRWRWFLVEFCGVNSFRAMGRPASCMIFVREFNCITYNAKRCRRILVAGEFSTGLSSNMSEFKKYEVKLMLIVFFASKI